MFQSYFVLSNVILFTLLIALQDTTATTDDANCPSIKLKSEWGGKPSTIVNYRPLPTKNVIIYSQIWAPVECTDFLSCAYIVQSIQNIHLIIGLDDIGYNFLISNEGLVFEGSGWYIEGGNSMNATSIGFIGKSLSERPSNKSIEACKQLLKCGVENGFLDRNFDTYNGTQLLSPRLTKILNSNLDDLK